MINFKSFVKGILLGVLLLPFLALFSFNQSVSAQSTTIRLAVMSDSSSDEYRANDNRAGGTQWENTTLAWTELLNNYSNFYLGPWGTRSEPRRTGFEYNWARSGAKAHDVITSGQHTGVANQVSAGLIDIVYFQIGNNDFAYYNDGEDIYDGTLSGQALQNKIDAVISDIFTATNTVLNSNSNIKIILGTIPDMGETPYWQSKFPDPQKRQRVTDAINQVNTEIITFTTNHPRLTLYDLAAFGTELLSRVDVQGNLHVGGELITLIQNGNEPHHAVLGDNIHGGTVLEGLAANSIIGRVNQALSTNIPEFTDEQILSQAGITPAPTPTVIMTPTPEPSPTPTTEPTPSPTSEPTPTPSPTTEPTPTPTLEPTPTSTPTPTTETLTKQIAAGSDDVNERGGTYTSSSSSLWVGNYFSTSSSYTGFRFTTINIPQGATIIEAKLEARPSSTQSTAISYNIYGELSPNSQPFSSSNRPSARPRTLQFVSQSVSSSWTSGNWYPLGDIKQVVSEITSQPTWQSGNAMSFVIRGQGSSWIQRRIINSFEGNPAFSPKLTVTYTVDSLPEPTPTPTQEPSPTPTTEPSPTPTTEPTPSPASEPTPTPSPTTEPTPTPTLEPTPTSTPNPTSTPQPTPTFTPTSTPTPTPTPTPTATPSPTPSPTPIPPTHTIQLVSKPNSASQPYIAFDGIVENSSTQTEVTSSRFSYSSGWSMYSDQGVNGSPVMYTIQNSKTITFNTSANSLQIMTVRHPQAGSFQVYVDSILSLTYNANSSVISYTNVPVPLD